MRKKGVGGGRARLSNLPPQPSAMAFTYLGQPTDSEARLNCSGGDIWVNEVNSDGQASTVPETSCDSDRDRRLHELAPNTTGETVVLAENSCGLGPQVHGLDDCVEMDWTEKEVCIKCDKGGKLLVCSDNNCPLAVHEECMLCSARIDSRGNFYCPYCSYKRAMLETYKARKKAMLAKKALSGFLDKGMVDGDPQKQKAEAERVRSKEPNPSTVVGVAKHDETMNRLDGDEADNHFVQKEEDQREERFDFCKGTRASAVTERNDVLSRCGDNVRPGDSGAHKIVIEQHTQPRPIIACGGSDSACCREEETGHQFEIVQINRSVQPHHPNLVDDHQNERELQDEQQPGPLTASPVEKERKLDDAIHISTTGGLGNADVVKEHEGSRPEEEAMQDQEQEPVLSSSGGDSVQQKYVKDSDLSHDDNEDVSPRWRRIKKNQNAVLPPSVYSPGSRQSARKFSEPNINVAHKKKKNATAKSRQQLKSPSIPHARRKKLPWTTEEEEMLKEGVQKFSTMVNKNLPWRKILEFGHHVFHRTRTPADLKDKWRNILVKECSTR